jgi:hypothetical protein
MKLFLKDKKFFEIINKIFFNTDSKLYTNDILILGTEIYIIIIIY